MHPRSNARTIITVIPLTKVWGLKPQEERCQFVLTLKMTFPWISAESTMSCSGSTVPSLTRLLTTFCILSTVTPSVHLGTITWGLEELKIPIKSGFECCETIRNIKKDYLFAKNLNKATCVSIQSWIESIK